MVDFTKLLNATVTEEAKRPPSLPQGTYTGVIQKWEPGESTQKKTPFVRFMVALNGHGDDVSEEAMEGIDLSKKSMRRDYFLTTDALYRLHEILGMLNIEFIGRPLSESLNEVIGKQVLAFITAKQNQDDPTQPPFNEIATLKALPED